MRKIKTMAALLVCLAMLCVLPATIHAKNEQPASSPTLPTSAENEDETNPVMTPENRAKLEAYEAKLRAEMEEDGVSLMAADGDIPTFNQYLADYNYNYNCYKYYRHEFNVPYRSYVEAKMDDNAYQALLTGWRLTTFSLSDWANYNNKEVGFYEAILFDVLYKGEDVSSASGNLNKIFKTAQVSTLKKVASFFKEAESDVLKKAIKKDGMSEEELNKIASAFNDCKGVSESLKTIGNISKVLGYVDNVEELIYKLCKAEVIAQSSKETAKILLMMKDNTTNPAFRDALDNMILVCSENSSEESIIEAFTSDMVVEELEKYSMEKLWKGVKKHLGLYGYAVSAGQAVGKTLSGWLFSTDEDVEMYYSLCALYEFENALKSAISTCEYRYTSSNTDENARLFNESYTLLLDTYVFGLDASKKYIEIEYEHGLVNKILKWFKGENYDDYYKSIENLMSDVNMTIEFMNTIAYNSYVDEYGINTAPALNISPEPEKYTETQKQKILDDIIVITPTLGNIKISEDKTLNDDMHTYGSLILEGGTLDLNGHTLTVDGNILQSGGTMKINGGKLIVGGDYEMASEVKVNGEGEKEYSQGHGSLTMELATDYVLVNGDFAVCLENGQTLSNGTLEVKGNFKQIGIPLDYTTRPARGFDAQDNHKVIFSGTEQQRIYFDSPDYSGFANVEFKNPNIRLDSGIRGFTLNENIDLTLGTDDFYISGTLNLNGHTITNKKEVELGDFTFSGGNVTLNSAKYIFNGDVHIDGTSINIGIMDTTIHGNLFLDYGILDLNGHTLTVDGNILQSGGTMKINGGKLIVGGDYEMASNVKVNGEGEKEYSQGHGSLKMELATDYVLVNGDFAVVSDTSQNLTNGVFEIKGNFKQIGTYNWGAYCFDAQDNHKVIFSGTKQQRIYFDSPNHSGFAYLEITNTTGPIIFTSEIRVASSLSQPGGAEIVNPENVALDYKAAFEDRDILNKEINAYVGNAENVIPTWKDCEAYDAQLAPTVYPYDISSINLLDSTGTELEKAPVNASFVVNVDVMKKQSRSGRDYVFVAVYDKAGALLNIDYVQADFSEGKVYSFGFNVPAQTAEIGEIKAFVWHSFSDPQPLAESKTL